MTMSALMSMRGSGKKPAPKPSPEGDPQKKGGGLGGYGMLLLAVLLFTVGGIFNNAPLQGNHKLLVATSDMTTKELQKTVLFLVRHDRGGAVGFVINKPGANGAPGYGGPTEKDKIYALHSLDVTFPETQAMEDVGLGLLTGKDAIAKLKAAKTKPSWYVIVNGYAGWGTRQMEAEMGAGLWQLVEFDKDVLTRTPAEKFWDTAHKMPRLVMTH